MLNRALGLLALLILVANSVAAQERLSWKFNPGEEFAYRIVTSKTSRLDGSDDTTTQKEVAETSWKLIEVDGNGVARLNVRFTRICLESERYSYDSANPSEARGGFFLRRLKGSFTEMLDSRYEVRVHPRGSARMDPAQINGLKYMTWTALHLGLVLAADENEKWSAPAPLATGLSIKIRDCVLKGIEKKDGRRNARIDFTVRAPTEKEASHYGFRNGPTAAKNLRGKGTAWFDLEAGRLVRLESESRVTDDDAAAADEAKASKITKTTITLMPSPKARS